MAFTPGTRIGVYEVVAQIGVGGMGEVYRALDTHLKRQVAIKVLRAAVAHDADRIARFQREAEVLARLNHPNIAAIYGVDHADGHSALIMELVEGPTLADRIARGAIPVNEAAAIAKQIADALEAAHRQGIIHRDLKPANIKVRPDGTVKVLDFGLAKALEPTAPAADMANSPTLTSPAMTEMGMILGTAAYMSPEQARGQRVDAQTDIWAFGCVLYEMLTGRTAFGRATVTDTMAAVIEKEPDWTALPRSTSSSVIRLLRRTLEKNPSRRLHAIADVRLDLDEMEGAPEQMMAQPAVPSLRRSARPLMLGVAAVAIVLLVGIAWLVLHGGGTVPSGVPTRVPITAPGQVVPQMSVAVSPDGRRLVYVSTDAAGGARLWVRELDTLAPRVLAGTEDAAHPAWSPDGSAIAFVAQAKLKRVDLKGGQVLPLVNGGLSRGGVSWSSTGVILFKLLTGDLATVPENGGDVSTVLKGEQSGGWPFFLPDGRHFVFHRPGADNTRGVYVGSLGSATTKLVLRGDFQAVFAAPDYLLFARQEGVVLAQHFDLERLELTGQSFSVAEGVWSVRFAAHVSLSAVGGVLAYVNATVSDTELGWFDRSGLALGTMGKPGPYDGLGPRISPDATRVAFSQYVGGVSGGAEVWVTTLADGTSRRLTLDPFATRPIWSSDGKRILFTWAGPDGATASIQDVRGETPEIPIGQLGSLSVWDWSPDGKWIVVSRGRPSNLWLLPVGAPAAAVEYAHSGFNKTQAQVSPDGRWLAYTTYESGRDEVYVDSFPTAGHRQQVSVGGGMQPRWKRNGGELFYIAPDQTLMAVPVTIGPGRFDPGRATPLFRTRLVPTGSQIDGWAAMYDVTADGQRFLLNGAPAAPEPPITVVLNWAAGVK
jgi:Tol biopolymer transport system component